MNELSELARKKLNVESGVKQALKSFPVTIQTNDENITIHFQNQLLCGIEVNEDGYRIWGVSSTWKEKTTYFCEEDGDTWCYYVDRLDDCVGEVQRLVRFEAQNGSSVTTEHTSELSKIITLDKFENAFKAFMMQADENVKNKVARGAKTAYGFSEKIKCDGFPFLNQYGQGAPSAAPHMNWWAVSIYYIPSTGKIVLGIEYDEKRYAHVAQMKHIGYEWLGNKKVPVASFYSATRDTVNYKELHEKFISVCEEVLRLGFK